MAIETLPTTKIKAVLSNPHFTSAALPKRHQHLPPFVVFKLKVISHESEIFNT